jgi:hypothetical protein
MRLFPDVSSIPEIISQAAVTAIRWVRHTPTLHVGSLLFFGVSSRQP